MKFAQHDDAFVATLRLRVDEMFSSTGRRRRDCTAMYLKTAIIIAWFAASYVLLVWFAATWWQSLLAVAGAAAGLLLLAAARRRRCEHCGKPLTDKDGILVDGDNNAECADNPDGNRHEKRQK